MSDLLTRMAEIRERQGLPPIDGSAIQGEPVLPPAEGSEPVLPQFQVRPPVDISQVPEGPPEYLDEDPDFETETPLVPRTSQTPVPEFQQNLPQPLPPAPDFALVGNEGKAYIASYLGRQVELSESEVAQAKALVLRAIQRSVQAQLSEIQALLPKRKRVRRKRDPNEKIRVTVAGPTGPPREEWITRRELAEINKATKLGAGVLPGTVSAEVGVHDSPGPQPASSPKKRGRPRKARERLDGQTR